jgi:predicted acylesterase/phospholipase RssA/CRP-like cAMP-binding protein
VDLSTISLFEGLGPGTLNQIHARAVHKAFPAGSAVCREGDPGDSMFVIEHGSADVTISGQRVRRLRQGDVIGEIAVLTGEPRSATVTAVLPTDAIELHRDALAPVLAQDPKLLANLTRVLSRRLASAHDTTVASRRGEAVGVLFEAALLPFAKAVMDAAAAASPRPTVVLDLAAINALDQALREAAFVFVPAELTSANQRQLQAHMDRVVVVDASVLHPDDPASVARLGRLLTRTRLGLALGAGGAKGFAHVGVLEVLLGAGYTVDCVAGSSIGAVVGACLAMGMSPAEIDTTLRQRFSPEVVKAVFSLSFSGTSSGYQTMKELTAGLAGDRRIEDLAIPLTVMTVDLGSRQPVPLSDGPLADALLAGTALAGLFPPFRRDGQRLVDGLALVPVPVESAVALGADVTVSVNLMSRDVLRAWPGDPEPSPDDPEAEGKPQRMLETLLEVMDLAQLDASVRHAAKASVAVTPRFGPCTWRDFDLADRFLEAGRAAARDALPLLLEIAKPQGEINHG